MDDGGVEHTRSSIEDIAYLARSPHRIESLEALTDRPRSRAELCELTGVSSSTIRRTLGEFEERSWVERLRYRYEATRLGEVVADGMADLIGRLETERTLRDVWDWVPEEVCAFTLEEATEATVTVADATSPYRPVNRFRSLLTASTTCRFVGSEVGLYEPSVDLIRDRVVEDGIEVTVVDPPRVADYMYSQYRSHCTAMFESGNLTALVCADLPAYGVSLFDDRVAVSGYDGESGSVRVLVDTTAPAAREWAESVFETAMASAHPFDPDEHVG